MNRLQYETSPYLLQHANNPVDWYPWSEEAFEKARREDLPVIVSIGYSTCHWCHVMERESFEDKDTADFMNEHFVSIKVDREERPDVDQIYMEACQVLNGNGGWPLNCFLLPDGRPFYAGTYYPPFPQYNRPSWMQVMQHMLTAYRDRKDEVEDQATRLLDTIAKGEKVFRQEAVSVEEGDALFAPAALDRLTQALLQRADHQEGGFGGAPKFPSAMVLTYLLEYHHFTGNEAALEHVRLSLDKMMGGGIYDQLGGGFARYATDRAWLVPHFEKMLYDNALLIGLYADAYRREAEPAYQRIIEESLAFIEREMSSPLGGFYSALDADSEGEEGKYYVWSQAEIEAALGSEAGLFSAAYGTSERGNWEGANIPWRARPLAEVARDFGLAEQEVAARLAEAREKLLAKRAQRIRPGLDDKQLLGWNALMITAYAKAYQALGREAHRRAAQSHLAFILQTFTRDDAGLWHTYKEGRALYPAFLDDYAFLIAALIDVYGISFDASYLERASALTDYALAHFFDETEDLFYFTSDEQTDIPLRRKELYDSATPSGNATMALNLRRLAVLTWRADWDALSVRMLRPMASSITQYPTSFGRWALALLHQAYGPREVAVVGPEAKRIGETLARHWLPNTYLMASEEATDAYPLLAGRTAQDGRARIFVCRQFACRLPVTEVSEALEQLKTI